MDQDINVKLLLLLDGKLHVLIDLRLVRLIAELAILVGKTGTADLCIACFGSSI